MNIGDDYLDSRDIERRIDELDSDLTDRFDEYNADGNNINMEWSEWLGSSQDDEDVLEYQMLMEFRDDVGSREWHHGLTLIHEDKLEEAMDEMVHDWYTLPKDLPSFMTLTIDYEALKMDYSQADIDGNTYYYRD